MLNPPLELRHGFLYTVAKCNSPPLCDGIKRFYLCYITRNCDPETTTQDEKWEVESLTDDRVEGNLCNFLTASTALIKDNELLSISNVLNHERKIKSKSSRGTRNTPNTLNHSLNETSINPT